jgi:hypothetical protein
MRFISKSALGALVAVVVMSVVGAVSASAALPEFKGTFPTRFEARGSAPLFQGKTSMWQYHAGVSITGTITGAKTLEKVTIAFSNEGFENEGTGWGSDCDTEGKKLVFSGLGASLGYIKKEKATIVGLRFAPSTQPLAKCTDYLSNKLEYTGGLIVPIGPINTKTTKFTLKFSQHEGKNEYRSLEGETKLTPFTLSNSTKSLEQEVGIENGETTLDVEKAIEIAA